MKTSISCSLLAAAAEHRAGDRPAAVSGAGPPVAAGRHVGAPACSATLQHRRRATAHAAVKHPCRRRRLPAGDRRQAAHRGLQGPQGSRRRYRSGPTENHSSTHRRLGRPRRTPWLRDPITPRSGTTSPNRCTVIVVETQPPTVSVMGEVNRPGRCRIKAQVPVPRSAGDAAAGSRTSRTRRTSRSGARLLTGGQRNQVQLQTRGQGGQRAAVRASGRHHHRSVVANRSRFEHLSTT